MNKFILIGLGNPGKEYEFTRHNTGKLFVRYLVEHPVEGVEAIETECYMNESGGWLQRELQRRGLWEVSRESRVSREDEQRKPHSTQLASQHITHNSQLIVVHDDLDIPIGSFKIQFGKGPRQHKGILSIEAALGTTEFWRVRIGIDARQGREKREGDKENRKKIKTTIENGEEYVLQPFSKAERAETEELFPQIRDQLRVLLRRI